MKMVNLRETIFFVLLVCTTVLCDIPASLKDDFFNIYKGVALTTKNLTQAVVTRDQITFRMYRKVGNPRDAILTEDNSKLLEGAEGKIVFITHGWNGKGVNEWVLDLKDAFLKTYPNCAVITVDWEVPARQAYPISAISVFDIGNFIGDLVLDLVDNHGVNIQQFLLVGHSLGAQSSGFAGKRVQKAGKKLPRIFGLDPAGPLFDVRPDEQRLNPTDAEVVEVLHSDGGTFGIKQPCGTIDFFPNGGENQPGCTRVDLMDVTSVTDPVVCDHERSHSLFIEAVLEPTHMRAKQCSQWNMLIKKCDDNDFVCLGDLTTNKTGKYYFETNKESPYNIRADKASFGILDRVAKVFGKKN